MPRLNAIIQVDSVPVERAYVEHLVLGVGQPGMYMTDDTGRVRDEHGDLGIDSFTGNADIRVLCQNSVVAHTGMCGVAGSFILLENFDVYRNREVV